MDPKERIVSIRKSKNLKIKDVHNKLVQVFGKKALSYRTLLRAEKGLHEERDSSLYQLCVGLGVSLKELTDGLKEKTIAEAYYIKFNKRKNRCVYNENVFSDILTSPERKFLAFELTLKSKGRTKPEKDIKENYEKFIYITKGKVNCVIGDKTFTMQKGDSLSFNSSYEHYLENKASKKSRCLVVHNPGKNLL